MAAPRISVVVATTDKSKKTTHHLMRCLDCQTHDDYEVHIIEDSDRRGPAWARNQGVKEASGEIIAFTDDDCLPPPMWLEEIDSALSGDIDVVGDTLRNIRNSKYADFLRDHYNAAGERIIGGTGNIAYKREVLDDIGTFSTDYDVPGGEDHELLERAIDAGYRIGRLNIRLPHDDDMSREEFQNKIWNLGRADFISFQKGETVLLLKYGLFICPLFWPALFIKGWYQSSRPWMEAYFSINRSKTFFKHLLGITQ